MSLEPTCYLYNDNILKEKMVDIKCVTVAYIINYVHVPGSGGSRG